MEIILSENCRSFTGTISRSHGYCIRRVGDRFFSKRSTNRRTQPDGHWRFIQAIAHMSQNMLVVSDIRLSSFELTEALTEADYPPSAIMVLCIPGHVYNAQEILLLEDQLSNYMKSCNHES